MGFANLLETIRKLSRNRRKSLSWTRESVLQSTNQIVVATIVDFDEAALTKIAMVGSVGAACPISPYHPTGDGNATYALSTN